MILQKSLHSKRVSESGTALINATHAFAAILGELLQLQIPVLKLTQTQWQLSLLTNKLVKLNVVLDVLKVVRVVLNLSTLSRIFLLQELHLPLRMQMTQPVR
jgi:hypothetical protein